MGVSYDPIQERYYNHGGQQMPADYKPPKGEKIPTLGGSMSMNQSGGSSAQMPMGGGDFIGPLVTGLVSLETTRQTNKKNQEIQNNINTLNKEEAEKNRLFQQNMSNTAFERQMADLLKSGLNPLLAMQGSGASTPSGSVAQMEGQKLDNPFPGAMSSAIQLAQLGQSMQKQGAEIDLMGEQKKLTKAQTGKAVVDAQVAGKGIPQADVINRLYKWGSDMFTESKSNSALKTNPAAEAAAIKLQQKIKTGGLK